MRANIRGGYRVSAGKPVYRMSRVTRVEDLPDTGQLASSGADWRTPEQKEQGVEENPEVDESNWM